MTRPARPRLALAVMLLASPAAHTQTMSPPPSTIAGAALSIPTSGSGTGTLFLVGQGQAVKRPVQLGSPATFAPGDIFHAGRYLVILTSAGATQSAEMDVTPAPQPASLGFLAKPSRIAVGMRDGISGAVYVFDAYGNLIPRSMPVTMELSSPSVATRTTSATSHNGLAWARLDSTPKEGKAKFVARVGDISSTRVIAQVPGDPCSLTISAHPMGNRLEVVTAPIRDCGGNAVPDGTIVTFSEVANNVQSTVDVPIKQGFARVMVPAVPGAKISVASGVVAGNEIRWGGR